MLVTHPTRGLGTPRFSGCLLISLESFSAVSATVPEKEFVFQIQTVANLSRQNSHHILPDPDSSVPLPATSVYSRSLI